VKQKTGTYFSSNDAEVSLQRCSLFTLKVLIVKIVEVAWRALFQDGPSDTKIPSPNTSDMTFPNRGPWEEFQEDQTLF
jgi:hypothetical protein